jgi:TonB family protein
MAPNKAKRRAGFPLILTLLTVLHGAVLAVKLRPLRDPSPVAAPTPRVWVLKDTATARQIVRSSDSDRREERPDAFLSDKTRVFDRQTKAWNNGVFRDGGPGADLSFSDLGAGVAGNPFAAGARAYARKKTGAAASNDYLKDVPEGDDTNLNTVEFKYYGFYHRIRQKLEQFWGRSLHETAVQMAKEGRQVSAGDEHVTALRVTLNADGDVIDIEVLGTSGVKELDDAAIESFNEAGPFPNPPRDLVVDGKVVLEWGFVVNS